MQNATLQSISTIMACQIAGAKNLGLAGGANATINYGSVSINTNAEFLKSKISQAIT